MTLKSKPSIFNGDLAHLPEALHWLTTQKRWVVWRWVRRVTAGGKEKWTKPPYRPAFPKSLAKSDDPSSWGSYQDAVAAVAAGQADGIGVMLLPGEVAAADLDQCRDPDHRQDIGLGHPSLCRSRTARALSRGDGFRLRTALYRTLASERRAAPAVFVSPDQWRGARTVPQLRALHHDLRPAGGPMRDHGRDRRLSGRAVGAIRWTTTAAEHQACS